MSTVKPTDYYKALGISPQASPRQVKESYLGWIRYFDHPQERPKPGSLKGSLTEQIEQVQEAFDLLSDDAKREEYNARMCLNSDPAESQLNKVPAPPRAVGEVEVMIAKRKLVRTYLDFFGLNAKPFELTPDPEYLYLSSRNKEMLAQWMLALQENKGRRENHRGRGNRQNHPLPQFLEGTEFGHRFRYSDSSLRQRGGADAIHQRRVQPAVAQHKQKRVVVSTEEVPRHQE